MIGFVHKKRRQAVMREARVENRLADFGSALQKVDVSEGQQLLGESETAGEMADAEQVLAIEKDAHLDRPPLSTLSMAGIQAYHRQVEGN